MKFLRKLFGSDEQRQNAPLFPKFQTPDTMDSGVNHDYGLVYFRETLFDQSQRLKIGMQSGHIELMEEFGSEWHGPWRQLFIHLVPKKDKWPVGRYASASVKDFEDVRLFHSRYLRLLEGDGCHHYWLTAEDYEGNLVYDHHNVIYAYGDLDRYTDILIRRGFSVSDFLFPVPHVHCYHSDNSELLHHMLSRNEWHHSPLREDDTY